MPTYGKTGVLLVNLGTPDAPTRSAVYRYLKQFLLDRRVIDYSWLARNLLVRGIIAPFRSGSSAKLYKQLWTPEGSPLKVYGEQLAEGVQQHLGNGYIVALAMRYQNPSIQSAIKTLMAQQVSNIVVMPLFPQYASATTGSIHEEVMRLLRKQQVIPQLHFINSYYDYRPMIEVFVENARKFDIRSYDYVLFSYHGLPQRQLRKANDCGHCLTYKDCCRELSLKNQHCYSAQCYATSRAIAEELGIDESEYMVCFQSRLGREEWTQPYTVEVIKACAVKKFNRVLVFCPAFVADCLETTIEIGMEYKEEFEELGGERLDLVESLNAHPKWVKAVSDLIRAKVMA